MIRRGHGGGSAKAILLGEHAVVYGTHGLVAGLPLQAEAIAIGRDLDRAPTLAFEGGPRASADDGTELGRALAAIADSFGTAARGFDVTIESRIPLGVGLGSSAAMAVAVTRALAAALAQPLTDDQVMKRANAAESVFHTKPSGVDVAAATKGGLFVFRRELGPIEAITTRPPLIVACVEPSRPTRHMVEGLAQRREQAPDAVDPHVEAIEALVLEGTEAARARDWATLGEIFDRNHAHLCELGISTAGLNAACRRARQAGAFGAKLTGGGGGGCIIALAEERADAVCAALVDGGADVVVRP